MINIFGWIEFLISKLIVLLLEGVNAYLVLLQLFKLVKTKYTEL